MSEQHDKWHVNLYGSNQGRIYVGPLGYTTGVAEVHAVFDKEQAMKDAHLIVDAVNSVQALRDEVARLRGLLAEIAHDCEHVGSIQHLDKAERRTWTSVANRIKAALTPQGGKGGSL